MQLTALVPETLAGLKRGDKLEVEGVFVGVSDEPMLLELVGGNQEADEYLFDVRYFRILLGQVRLLVAGTRIIVEEL